MACSTCGQKRAAATKASPSRHAYNPLKSGQRMSGKGGTSSYGTPKVRMSFGRKKS